MGYGGQAKQDLSHRLDLVAEDEVGSQSEDNEEDAQDDEVHVELGVFHVQQLEDLLRLLELTHLPRTL